MLRVIAAFVVVAASSFAQQQPSTLAVTDAVIHQFEDGPPIPSSHSFLAGESVWISTRFSGYRRSANDRLLLRWQVDVFDPKGIPLVETRKDTVDVELAPQDKTWMPKVRHDFLIPPLADPGTYKVVITVHDDLAKTTATKELPFQVRGQMVEPSDTLVLRNFRFLRSEEDATALNPATYKQGDPVWARFDITGYKMGEKNRFHISYGVEVVRSDGKSMYSQPEAANERQENFYPKRYMPGTFSLQLTPDIAKTSYTVVIRVRDHVGQQDHEARHTFVVE